ncbi:MAG: ribonuclease D [Pseudomonadota bacterium]|nr:ribonuclease D [Pseudomonadota bacterium]
MMIDTTQDLTKLCTKLAKLPFVTVDTEFIREKTYYPELCLIQIASIGIEAVVDPLAPGIDLSPLYDLLNNPHIVKVFHAARQDIEIFYHLTKQIPTPLFDTQIAAMVCGYDENVGYQQLVHDITGVTLDKSMRFTDWKKRPLSPEQEEYALNDVTYLRDVYLAFNEKIKQNGRAEWLAEEIAVQNNPATYDTDDNEVWRKVKIPFKRPIQVHVFSKLCAWREKTAKTKNKPRKHLLKDDALIELAIMMPENIEDINKCRNISTGFGKSVLGQEVLSVIRSAKNDSPDMFPKNWEKPKGLTHTQKTMVDLYHLLLMIVATELNVAPKIIASSDELKSLACGDNDVPCMKGWRYDSFGAKVLLFKQGKLSFTYNPHLHRPEIADI